MRITASTLLGLLLLAQGHCFMASGQGRVLDRRTQLEDPMFGISFSYTKVHYEQMPTSIRHICRTFEHGTYWIFAHLQRESGEYYVVMGERPGQDGDSFGAALLVTDSRCYLEDSTRMLSGFVPAGGYVDEGSARKLPGLEAPQICDQGGLGGCHYVLQSPEEEGILRGLVGDALTRGALAWGGAERFKKEVCGLSLQRANSDTPLVQQEVSKFCNQRR